LRSALLSAVGHDLRTPLTAVKAAASSLRDPDVTLSAPDTAQLLATIEESANRLQALVDNLLDSARLATGAVVPQLRATAYDEIVAWALATVDGSRRVAVDLEETLPAVLADAGLLERVVATLVDNALRHGAGAPVAIRAAGLGEEAALHIVDRGPGPPPGPTDALFAPFPRRADRTSGPGIGLGLAVARGFTDAMGGRLNASPTPGGELTMTVTLPVDPLDAAPPPPVTAAVRP
jgi:two-component system sensor histidine kinase KdpD